MFGPAIPALARVTLKLRNLRVSAILSAAAAGALLCAGAGLQGCARVMQKDREYLSDPVMQLVPDPLGSGMESHNLPRREGSSGGGSGSGGGCGC